MRSDILAKLLEQGGCGNQGEDLFIHHMPSACTKGVLLKEPLTGQHVNQYLPGYFNTRFQIIIRAPTQADGDALCRKVIKVLRLEQERTFNEVGSEKFAMKVNHCLPEHLPIRFPRLDGSEIEWSINFIIAYVIPPP